MVSSSPSASLASIEAITLPSETFSSSVNSTGVTDISGSSSTSDTLIVTLPVTEFWPSVISIAKLTVPLKSGGGVRVKEPSAFSVTVAPGVLA
ncbi:hypothetical protein GMA8713_01527 [Grimontia marina]|uniref:Uncharacterized protein n=1 Tax=Grimontia marina TaxID=646534 RepID=A0A128F1G8_9GAMM|nr:hypothetical protein GMA8713_01527 [Grimontia marina]